MVRAAQKKQKGDDAFQTKKQKVGRKKLAPATSTRAEVSARGLRVGVAKSIVEAQNKAKQEQQQQQQSPYTSFSSSNEQQSLQRPDPNNPQGNNSNKQITIPDITTVLVAINHYKAGARTQALKNASIWVRNGGTASNSPSLTIQLLSSSLAALSDNDGPTRDAAAAVVSAIDQCVLIPSNSWHAVAENVCDRLNICLTHSGIGIRATAVQLLSDLSSEAKHETKSKMMKTFLSYFTSTAAAVAASSSSNSNSMNSSSVVSAVAAHASGATIVGQDSANNNEDQTQQQHQHSTKSRFEEHDESLRSLLRNTILVVKSKPTTHFPLLPAILKSALLSSSSSAEGNNSGDGVGEDGAATATSSSENSSSTATVSSFVSRNHSFVVDCLSEVWDFGCIRVKEQFETTVALLRNEPALKMILGILESTSILISVIAKNIKEDVILKSSSSSSSSSPSIQQLQQQYFPRKQLLGNILHLITTKVPFSLDELCSIQTTSARKSQLGKSLGEIYLSLLQLQDAAYLVVCSLPSQQQNNTNNNTANATAALVNQLLPASGDIKSTIKKSFFKILEHGLELPPPNANNTNTSTSSSSWIVFPELSSFSFSSLNQENFSFLFAGNNNSESSSSLFSNLPSWLMTCLTILDNNDKQQKQINSQTEEAIFGLLDLIICVSFSSANDNGSSDVKNVVIPKCWEKMVQFHFMLRGSGSNNTSSSSTTTSSIRCHLIQKTISLLYDFVSTCCRDTQLLNNLLLSSSSSSSWTNIFTSMSTVISMIQQQNNVPVKNTENNNNDGAVTTTTTRKTIIHLGSSFVFTPSSNSSSSSNFANQMLIMNQQQQLHETRLLAFGVLHFAGICLRMLNQPVPASWMTLIESEELRKEIMSKFHASTGSEYLRLLDRVLE